MNNSEAEAAAGNPYLAPLSPVTNIRPHSWDGREFDVNALLFPKTFWTIGEVTVVIDKSECHTSSTMKLKEVFEFQFIHKGQMVSGRFEQLNMPLQNLNYKLFIGGQLIGHSSTRVNGWLPALIVGLFGGFAAIALFYALARIAF